MPEKIGEPTPGVPIFPNSGGVEDTAQAERPPATEEAERAATEAEAARRTEEEAARETETGQAINTNA